MSGFVVFFALMRADFSMRLLLAGWRWLRCQEATGKGALPGMGMGKARARAQAQGGQAYGPAPAAYLEGRREFGAWPGPAAHRRPFPPRYLKTKTDQRFWRAGFES